MERQHFKVKDPHCTETWNNFSIVPWQSWLDHGPGTKPPLFNLGEELMMEAWHLPKNEEEGGFFYSPLSSQGMAPSHSPICKPHKHPILINHLSIILPLNELFLCWDKGPSSSKSPYFWKCHLRVSLSFCPSFHKCIHHSYFLFFSTCHLLSINIQLFIECGLSQSHELNCPSLRMTHIPLFQCILACGSGERLASSVCVQENCRISQKWDFSVASKEAIQIKPITQSLP